MKYFFILGNNTALSLAELAAAIKLDRASLVGKELLIAETEVLLAPENLIRRLGGTIKIGLIREELAKGVGQPELIEIVQRLALVKKEKSREGKFNFGFSDYGARNFNKQDLGLKLKKSFSEQGISSRFVTSRDRTLSSVIVEQNHLIARGIEIILAAGDDVVYVGETLAVQPFKELSKRDYGRPARDDLSGMLPPKLAQMMINMAQLADVESLLIDPFCGSGTVISEAMILGYKNLLGSDISAKAINDTKSNISWVKEIYGLKDLKLKFFAKDVLDLSRLVKSESVGAIITEPFLGPQRGRIDFEAVARLLNELYSKALKQFHQVLYRGGRVVMIWPVFYGNKPLNPDISGFRIINHLPENLRSNQFVKNTATRRGTVIYSRPSQKVFREVVVLEKE